jgi:ABC-type glycerol-3-phosphate transport system substrate-binding protein
MKKLISLLVLVAMVATMAVACGGNDAPAETTAKPGTDPVTEGATEPVTTVDDYAHDLPADLKFDGKELIIGTYEGGNIGQGWANFFDVDEPEPGNLIEEAAYNRNLEVEQLLGITITCKSDWIWQSGLGVALDATTQSGVCVYDVMFLESIYSYESLIIDELIKDIAQMPYMDLSKPYYNKMYNDTYYLRDNLYFFISDITYPCQNAAEFLVNLDELVDHGYEKNYLYEKVNNNDFILQDVFDMIEGTWKDLNGDNAPDMGDFFGFGGHPYSPCYLYPGAGLLGTYLTEDGFAFDYGTDYSIEVMDRIIDLVHHADSFVSDWNNTNMFFEGRALFMGYASTIRTLQDLDFECGVLPFPKFNEEQDRFYSATSGGAVIVPANMASEDFTGAVIEAMASGSGKYFVPAFYEQYLEQGVLNDDYSRENWRRMLNEWGAYEFTYYICPDERVKYFLPAYSIIEAGSRDFASSWDAQKDTVGQICQEFFDWYLAP